MKYTILIFATLLLFVGCGSPEEGTMHNDVHKTFSKIKNVVSVPAEPNVVLPVDGTIVGYNATYKRFGEYFQDRFRGYHIGDDIEVPPEDLGPGEVQEVPIRSIAQGVVKKVDWVGGYGGVMVVEHMIDDEVVTAIYGHIDLTSTDLGVGDTVEVSQFLANLGDDKSRETDGERQHLHFALYQGPDDGRLQGYERNPENLNNWINPYVFFKQHGVDFNDDHKRVYSTFIDPPGNKIFNIDFAVPASWDVEYIPSLNALNLYSLNGAGTARERSQILIRYFDASQFLTLNTVTIHEQTDLIVGVEDYVARRYDIEKKPGVPDFSDQPSWRNKRHIVTDFRKSDGRTRYYVVAANPELDRETYEFVLKSMWIK